MGRPRAEIQKVTLSVKVPIELKDWLVKHCNETDQSIGDIIAAMIEYYRGIE